MPGSDNDFEKIVAKIKKEREEADAAAVVRQDEAETARTKAIEEGRQKLRTFVRPMLAEAGSALATEKIFLTIREEFDVENRHDSVLPHLVVQCHSDPSSNLNQWAPQSRKLYIGSDGKRLEIGSGSSMSSYSAGPKHIVNNERDFRAAIIVSFEECLRSYYEEADRN